MSPVSNFLASLRKEKATEEPSSPVNGVDDEKKDPATTVTNGTEDPVADSPDRPTEDAQRGVQRAEAVTLAWSKPYLIAVFVK